MYYKTIIAKYSASNYVTDTIITILLCILFYMKGFNNFVDTLLPVIVIMIVAKYPLRLLLMPILKRNNKIIKELDIQLNQRIKDKYGNC